jgi:hypothetical protein
MATIKTPVLGGGTIPDTSGNVWFEPMGVSFGSNNLLPGLIGVYADTATKDKLYGRFVVPKNFVSNSQIVIRWAATVTSGKVQWEFAYVSAGATATYDPAAVEETVTGNPTVAGTARLGNETTIAMTSGNFAADDEVEFYLARDGTSGNDTMAGSSYLFEILFQYTDI